MLTTCMNYNTFDLLNFPLNVSFILVSLLLEAYLLYNQIYVTDSSLASRLALSTISPLFWIDLDVLYGFVTMNLSENGRHNHIIIIEKLNP